MNIISDEGLTFDDVTLLPTYSTVKSRSQPDTKVTIAGLSFDTPIIAAPMNTVCEHSLAFKLATIGADSVIHRYMSSEDQVKQLKLLKNSTINGMRAKLPFFAVGATGDYLERVAALYVEGATKFCVDVANGDSKHALDALIAIRKEFPDVILMGGNVCTKDGFARIAHAGANLIRVGVGSGAVCKTRLVTGHGVPQLTALKWAAEARRAFPNVGIISDGGIRTSGDIVKALALADVVMLGSLLAGTLEAPGDIIEENGQQFKLYAGMASTEGRKGWFDQSKTSFVPEGEATRVKYTGCVVDVVEGLIGGLKVGMSYSGAFSLEDFRKKATFMKVSPAGYIEGTPHGKK